MIDLVRRKHYGDGWLVFSEVGNRPGLFRDRIADGLALGVWASKKYEAHLYEFKESRGDLKKELDDYKKAEGVGQHCHYWWLAIRDPKIIEGLAIPDVWGIVTPEVRGGVEMFKVLRKAPNLKPKPFGPMFAVSLLRNMAKKWTPTHELETIKKKYREEIKVELTRDLTWDKQSAERDYRKLVDAIKRFEDLSGVRITYEYGRHEDDERDASERDQRRWLPVDSWQVERLGKAVEAVIRCRETTGSIRMPANYDEQEQIIEREIAAAERSLHHYEQMIGSRKAAIETLQYQLNTRRAEIVRERQTSGLVNPDGDSPAPSDGPDHAGGTIDRGHPRAHQQDAGVELRDQRAEVPHGQQAPAGPR